MAGDGVGSIKTLVRKSWWRNCLLDLLSCKMTLTFIKMLDVHLHCLSNSILSGPKLIPS